MNNHTPLKIIKPDGMMIVLLDLQQPNDLSGKHRYGEQVASCLQKIKSLLDVGRELELKIAHFRRIVPESELHSETATPWLEGFQPRNNEHVYERRLPSCFSNRSFLSLIENIRLPHLLFAGISGERSCLATAVESYHRGCKSTFIRDCSATYPIGNYSESESHTIVFHLISLYAQVANLNETLMLLQGHRY